MTEETTKRRGRPKGSAKESIHIRLDSDTLARFRATGAGWQSRLNTALRSLEIGS